MTTYRTGYRLAIQVLRGVAARSGSDAARWAADYLEADPDRHLTHGDTGPCPEPGVHALDGDAPETGLRSTESAQTGPARGSGCTEAPQPLEHRPETLGGDGLGYGRCAGCGELWPCTSHRANRAKAIAPEPTRPRHGAVI